MAIARLQVGLVGRRVDGLPTRQDALRIEVRPQPRHHGPGDLVLELERVAQLAVVALAPQVAAVAGLDELDGDSHALTGAAHAPLQDALGAQSRARLADVEAQSRDDERGGPRDDAQALHSGQRADDLLGQTLAQGVVRGVAAEVGERQHRDRGRRRSGSAEPLHRRRCPVSPAPDGLHVPRCLRRVAERIAQQPDAL